MAQTHAAAAPRKHDYHLVDPSPWPILMAIAVFTLAGGLVIYMHKGGPWLLAVGVAAVIALFYVWWRDVVQEAEFQGHHTPVVQLGLRYGMALFISSEVMFFSGFFWAFFNAALFPSSAIGSVWPPKGIQGMEAWGLPFLNTLILLTSGTTVTWAHHALREGKRDQVIQGLILTILLGLTFTAIQGWEYYHAPFKFTDGIYPSTFFLATGFHGLHVIIGTTFLIVCLIRAWKGHFTPEHHFGFEAAAWYWHFVDVVWLFLFFCIYWGVPVHWWGLGH